MKKRALGHFVSHVRFPRRTDRFRIMTAFPFVLERRVQSADSTVYCVVLFAAHIPHPVVGSWALFACTRRAGVGVNRLLVLTNFRSTRQAVSAEHAQAKRAASYLVLCILDRAGFFASVDKCVLVPTTRLVYLGLVRDAALWRIQEVTESVLVSVIRGADGHTASDGGAYGHLQFMRWTVKWWRQKHRQSIPRLKNYALGVGPRLPMDQLRVGVSSSI